MEDNSQLTKPGLFERSRADESYQLFLAKVGLVDYERKVVTIQDIRSGEFYENIPVLPANESSVTATDVQMPETGSTCLACVLYSKKGYTQMAIVNYVAADTVRAQDAIATRPVEEVSGWNERKRGTFRKAYPGQKTISNSSGYTARIDEGWDYASSDFSRDKLDAHRRTHTQVTSRRVSYTDAGVSFTGPVNRPDAASIPARRLPDGSKEFVLYLQENTDFKQRYLSGQKDLLPIVENLQRIQEFALDYPLPMEVLETDLLDFALGTSADPWGRTAVSGSPIAADDQTKLASQTWDHPTSKSGNAVGPTLAEGRTPRRRAFIIERSEGTLVGYNRFDTLTYGQILKPALFPYTRTGRFGADLDSWNIPVKASVDHVEARLAASALSVRFPHEYNTTRYDVTKEGFVSMEIGATLPKENVGIGDKTYEHPHGAGRSLEAHLVGSAKLVIGKNRDEEDAIDAQILGQTVLRLGADDASVPDARRQVHTQMRGQADAVHQRTLQYWDKGHRVLNPGDAVDLENKKGAENVSLRAAFDGGTFIRLGARDKASKRRHLINGYIDGPGVTPYGIEDAARIDSKSAGRKVYQGTGDNPYAFHDMTQITTPVSGFLPYASSGDPTGGSPELHGLSLDFHAVRDIFLRVGKNELTYQSVMMDLAGGLAAFMGKDKQGRSISATLDGGVEMVIGRNNQKKSLRIEFNGDVDWAINGNFQVHVTGDSVFESTSHRQITKTDYILTADKVIESARTRHTTESVDIVNNQGLYSSDENT